MMNFPHDLDKECADGLSREELSELVIGYAQENERLEGEIKRLKSDCEMLRANFYPSKFKYLGMKEAFDFVKDLAKLATAPAPSKKTIMDMIAGTFTPEKFKGDRDVGQD